MNPTPPPGNSAVPLQGASAPQRDTLSEAQLLQFMVNQQPPNPAAVGACLEICRRFRRKVLAVAKGAGLNAPGHDAEDIVEYVFKRLFDKARDPAFLANASRNGKRVNIYAWLCKTQWRYAADLHRLSRLKETPAGDPEEFASEYSKQFFDEEWAELKSKELEESSAEDLEQIAFGKAKPSRPSRRARPDVLSVAYDVVREFLRELQENDLKNGTCELDMLLAHHFTFDYKRGLSIPNEIQEEIREELGISGDAYRKRCSRLSGRVKERVRSEFVRLGIQTTQLFIA